MPISRPKPRPRPALAEALEPRKLLSGVGPQAAGDSDDQLAEFVPTGNGITAALIADPQDVDMFGFIVDRPRQVEFDIDSESLVDTYLRLFDGNGTELAANDEGEGDFPEPRLADACIYYNFAAAGIYYLGVSDAGNAAYDPVGGTDAGGGSTGSYLLVITGLPDLDDPNDQIAEAPLVSNGSYAGRIESPNDVDLYHVVVRAGDRVTVDLDMDGLSGFVNTYLRVFDGAGNELISNDDGTGPAPEYNSTESFLLLPFISGGDVYLGVSAAVNDDYNPVNGLDGDFNVGGSVGAYTLTLGGITSAAQPSHVTQVYLSGTGWTEGFRQFLANRGQGSAQYGYAVPAADQLNELPWAGMNQISATFDQDVSVKQADLKVRGSTVANYSVANFAYDPATKTATWTLSQPVANDKLMIDLDGDAGGVSFNGAALDGEWNNAGDTFPSGDGVAGGDFRFRVNLLPGDVNRDGRVNAVDLSNVRARQLTSTGSPGTAPNTYNVFSDINGSGNVNAVDLGGARTNQLRALPAPEPTAGPALPRRRLFGEILV